MNYIVFDGSKDPSCAKCRFRNGEICVVTGEERLYQICPIRTLPDDCVLCKKKQEVVERFPNGKMIVKEVYEPIGETE